jgi:hypothetical protein
LKKEKPAPATKTGPQVARQQVTALKRKRTFDTSQLADLSESELGRLADTRPQHGYAKLKRVRYTSASDEQCTDAGAAKPLPAPRKKPAAGLARKKYSSSKSENSTPLEPKARRPPPVFKPLSGKPLPRPQWTTPPTEPAKTFLLPSPYFNPKGAYAKALGKQQKKSVTIKTSKAEKPLPFKPSYAEIEPFIFKLVVSYSKDGMEYHQSTDLENNMKSFWSHLKRLREGWEEVAGAEWAWELQKPGRAREGRLCVSSTLAKQSTVWREGDAGNFACEKCAMDASLCFTWVKDEDAEHVTGDDDIPDPKGEFWCLPIHRKDRRSVVRKDREIRTWLNEEDVSESDSSGDEVRESSDEHEFKPGPDYDQISQSESSSEEGDHGEESDEDDELCVLVWRGQCLEDGGDWVELEASTFTRFCSFIGSFTR